MFEGLLERLLRPIAWIMTSRENKPEPPDKLFTHAMQGALSKHKLNRKSIRTFKVDGYNLRGVYLDERRYFGVGEHKNHPKRLGIKSLGLIVRSADPAFKGTWEFTTELYGTNLLATRNHRGLMGWRNLSGQALMSAVLESVFTPPRSNSGDTTS